MRPIKLTLENFGPYREPAEIDFTGLGELFLVWGPTGSGKSTLFDAMAYALYGALPGERKKFENQLASQHSPPGSIPRVVFEFSLGGERLKVERTPPYTRPKRGGGTIETQPEALLQVDSGRGWEPVADKIRDVTACIQDRIGLSAEEFSKIILLPQGEFEEFLKMDSTDRVKVLETLFPVELHDAVTALAATKASQIGVAAASLDGEIARLRAEAGESPEARLDELRAASRTAQSALDAATSARYAIEARHEMGTARLARIGSARLAASTLETLQAQSGARTARLARLEKAKSAARLSPLLAEAGRAAETLGQEAARLDARMHELENLESRRADIDALKAGFVSRRTALQETAREITLLEKAAGAWAASFAAGAAYDKALRREDGARAACETAEVALAAAEAARSGLEVAPETEAAARRSADLADNLFRETQLRQADARALCDLEAASIRQSIVARETEAVATAAAARLAAARRAWEAAEISLEVSHAARLAAGLRKGQPCPVCGSTTHPAPALSATESDTDVGTDTDSGAPKSLRHACESAMSDSAQADERRVAAALRLEEMRRAELEYRESHEALRGSVGAPSAIFDEAAAATKAAEAAALSARAALSALETRRAEALAAATAVDSARAAAGRAREVLAEARIASAAAKSALDAARAQAGPVDPQTRLDAAADLDRQERSALAADEAAAAAWDREHAAAAAHAAESARILTAARAQAAEARSRFDSACVAEDFSETDVRLQALDRVALETLEKAVADYDAALAAARSRFEALKADLPAPGAPEPDLEALRSELDAAVAEVAQRKAASDAADSGRDRFAALLERLAAAIADRKRLDAESGGMLALAALLKGELKGRRLPFKNFALGMYFSQVVSHASARLLEMSDGRYALRSEEAQLQARGRIGLGISVLDSFTGQARPTQTLSGGERFLTSVSLALGLADTIRARSGGVNLDAVFIDEGFGSLDEESLDRAISVLDRLRGARTIGIVSHVAELRARIPSRIEVVKGVSGSTLRIV